MERAARLVSIARWLTEVYPEVAQALVDNSYESIKVFVPQVIDARTDFIRNTPTYKEWLIGGVVFPNVNKTVTAGGSKVGDTVLDDVAPKVLQGRKGDAPAWEVPMGKNSEDRFYAWKVSGMNPKPMQTSSRTEAPSLAHNE